MSRTCSILLADDSPECRPALEKALAENHPEVALIDAAPADLVAKIGAEREQGRWVTACVWSFDRFGPPAIVAAVHEVEPRMLWIIVAGDAGASRDAIAAGFEADRDQLWCVIERSASTATLCSAVGTAVRHAELLGRYGEQCTINEVLEVRADKRTRDILEAYTALQARTDELQRTLDLLKQAEAQLVQREKLAVFGTLAASIAHEVNNPSAFILANLEVLRDDVAVLLPYAELVDSGKNAEGAAYWASNKLAERIGDAPAIIKECIEGIGRIVKLVSDLRTYGRVDKNEMSYVHLDQVVAQAVRILTPELRRRGSIEVVAGAVPDIRGSAGRLLQVFINIIHNGVQAFVHGAPQDNRIRVELRPMDDRVEIDVTDNGCGMDPEQVSRIFDPFYTTKPAGEGTGLGLSISKSIVEQHGGAIHVRSKRGEGTCFTVSLPKAGRVVSESIETEPSVAAVAGSRV